jgi:hypothetical protein
LYSVGSSGEVGGNIQVVVPSPVKRRYAHLREVRAESFERQDAGVVGDAAVLPELGLDRFVSFVGFAGFGDGPNAQLGRKIVLVTDGVVDQLLHLELGCGLVLEAGGRNLVAGGVKRFHRGEKPLLAALVCFQVHLGDGLHATDIIVVLIDLFSMLSRILFLWLALPLPLASLGGRGFRLAGGESCYYVCECHRILKHLRIWYGRRRHHIHERCGWY